MTILLNELRKPEIEGRHTHPMGASENIDFKVQVIFLYDNGQEFSFYIDRDSDVEN